MRTGGGSTGLIPAVVVQADGHPDYYTGVNEILRELAQYAEAQLRGAGRFRVVMLSGPRARRSEFKSTLDGLRDAKGLVIFFGHGCLCGDSWFETQPGTPPNVAMTDGVNCELLEGKVVYAVACHSAKVLGRRCVIGNRPATCYIGFCDKVYISRQGGPTWSYTAPLKAGIKALAEQKRCVQAHHAIRSSYESGIDAHLRRYQNLDALILANSLDALSQPLGNASASV